MRKKQKSKTQTQVKKISTSFKLIARKYSFIYQMINRFAWDHKCFFPHEFSKEMRQISALRTYFGRQSFNLGWNRVKTLIIFRLKGHLIIESNFVDVNVVVQFYFQLMIIKLGIHETSFRAFNRDQSIETICNALRFWPNLKR